MSFQDVCCIKDFKDLVSWVIITRLRLVVLQGLQKTGFTMNGSIQQEIICMTVRPLLLKFVHG
jgi:hypothetical protein